jgi:hypothetical protein
MQCVLINVPGMHAFHTMTYNERTDQATSPAPHSNTHLSQALLRRRMLLGSAQPDNTGDRLTAHGAWRQAQATVHQAKYSSCMRPSVCTGMQCIVSPPSQLARDTHRQKHTRGCNAQKCYCKRDVLLRLRRLRATTYAV